MFLEKGLAKIDIELTSFKLPIVEQNNWWEIVLNSNTDGGHESPVELWINNTAVDTKTQTTDPSHPICTPDCRRFPHDATSAPHLCVVCCWRLRAFDDSRLERLCTQH